MISGFKTETSFISDQTYRDFILSGHSIILSMKLYSIYFPDQPYHPWIFGSNACEDHFAALRSFCRGKTNLCILDMIDLSGRIQKSKELKLEERCLPEVHTPGWNNVHEEIIEGMKSADKEVLKTIELLGMLPNLLKGNVLRQEGDKLIYLNRAVDTWIDSDEFMPDESTVVSLEELAGLDNGILFDSLDTLDENSNYLPFTDLAATVSSVTDLDGGDLDDVDDDDGHPQNCVFYAKGSCKYLDNSFVRPKKTSWIGCEFPGCNDWYHGTCLGIQLAQSEKESYTFICNKHAEGKGILKDKIQTSALDAHVLSKETCSAPSMQPKRKRSDKSSGQEKDYSRLPSYVEYEGHYYHISEVLSLQEGKVYRPASSRIARWMSSSQSDFYERIDEIISPQKTEKGIYLKDFASFWVQSKGLLFGQVIRIVWSPSFKSSYPAFEWKEDASKKGKSSPFALSAGHIQRLV